jgi:hypothetical protein
MTPGRLRVLCNAASAAGLYLLFLFLYEQLVETVNARGLLTGEEASVAFRDVAFLELRRQHNSMASSFTAHVIFWVGSYLAPGEDLFYGRHWKAALMATVPVGLYAFGVLRLGWSRASAVLSAALTGLLPGLLAFSWIAIEIGFEVLLGLLALLCATSGRPSAFLPSGFLFGVAAHAYPAGVSFLPGAAVCALAIYFRRVSSLGDRIMLVCFAGILTLALRVPKIWWLESAPVLAGGGSWDPAAFAERLEELREMLFERPGGYYYFNPLPALLRPGVGVAAVAGLVLSLRRWRVYLPLYAVAATSAAVYGVAGGVTGARRALPLVLCAGIFIGAAIDALLGVPWRGRAGRCARAAGAVLAGVLGVWLVGGYLQTRRGLEPGGVAMNLDFRFAQGDGLDMVESVEGLLEAPPSLPHLRAEHEADRTLAILHVIDVHRRRGAEPFYTRAFVQAALFPAGETEISPCVNRGWRCGDVENVRPAPGEVVLWEHRDGSGDCQILRGAAAPGGEHAASAGALAEVCAGYRARGYADDCVSSLRIGPETRVRACETEGGGGRCQDYGPFPEPCTQVDYVGAAMNDSISWIRIVRE